MTASVLTFTVQAGTGGGAIAQLVAQGLGYAYLDEEIVRRAASLAGVSPRVIASSERWRSFGERLLNGFMLVSRDEPSPAAHGHPDAEAEQIDPRYYRFFVDRVVLQLVHSGNCVIAGHAAQATLRGRGPGVCSVLIHGNAEARARRIAREDGLREDDAMTRLRRLDRDQSEFLKHLYQVDWLDPSLYQIALNTDDLDDAAAAELIVRLATSVAGCSDVGASIRSHKERAAAGEHAGRRAPATAGSPLL